jgi:hypothetical protein
LEKGGSGVAERSRGAMAEEKRGSKLGGKTREREEARSENECHRHVLHFCVMWEARLKMRNEDWYFVGDISVSYSAMLETHLTFFAVYWR